MICVKLRTALSKTARFVASCSFILSLTLSACAQRQTLRPSQTTTGGTSQSAFSQPKLVPRRYNIRPEDLPAPNASGDSARPSRLVPRPAGAFLRVPAGFTVSVFAEGDFQNPRWMALAPNGDVFLADSRAGVIYVLRDTNGDGAADTRFRFATGLEQPFGMAFWRDYLYVANTNRVVRFRYRAGQTEAEGGPERIADLPGLGYNQHWTRNIIFRPDGSKMYVSVGSETNVMPEAEPMRAAITEFNPDGTGKRIFASGLRNPVGLAFYPGTNSLWATVNERDRLGDDLVPDYFTEVREWGFYGWPFSYVGRNVDPRRRGERPDLVERTVMPDVLIQAHSAALGLVFYDGRMFPEEYQGDAFIALRGSWNRARLTGYKIIRVPFENGRPVGGYEDFLTGWLPDENGNEVWGRPVGLLVMRDGSLLIADDEGRRIWRVSYTRTSQTGR
jgi:glucose/arabinose dehydrogenase